LAPRAREIADALMAAPHTVPLDQLAAEEIGALLARIEALDAALENRQPGSKGTATLLDLRLRASARLERWLREFGPHQLHARSGRHNSAAVDWPPRDCTTPRRRAR